MGDVEGFFNVFPKLVVNLFYKNYNTGYRIQIILIGNNVHIRV